MTIVLFLFVPASAFAAEGTLGEETPNLYCRFTDSYNKEVDGNELTSGTYTVEVILEGMEAFSVFQFTAKDNYNSSVLTSLEVTSVYEGTNSDVSCGGIKYDSNGNRVVVLASENADCSALNSEGTVMATMIATIETDAKTDFQDLFKFVTDPDLTFVEADYGDGINDAYVLDMEPQTSYSKYQMTADESPALSGVVNVDGAVMIANDIYGNPSGIGVAGITVSVTVGDETIEAVTDENGEYSLKGLPFGTYTVSISGETTIDRIVTLPVTSDRVNGGTISANNVGVIICDYVKDGAVDGADKIIFGSYYKKSYYIYADINPDNSIDSSDKVLFGAFYDKTFSYDNVTI